MPDSSSNPSPAPHRASGKRGLYWSLGALLLVGGAVTAALVLAAPKDDASAPSSQAEAPAATLQAGFGTDAAGAALWVRLSRYRQTYLNDFDRAFKTSRPRAATVLQAVGRLMDRVTGPRGFWRDQVPNEVYECYSKVNDPICDGLDSAWSELERWELMQGQISRLDPSRADVYLNRNAEAIGRYLDRYVPDSADAAGMRQTAFFSQRISKLVAGGER